MKNKKKKKKELYIYGRNTIEELLKDNFQEIVTFYIDFSKSFSEKFLHSLRKKAKQKNIELKTVDQKFFNKIFSPDVNTQGIAAKLKGFKYKIFSDFLKESKNKDNELVLLLDKIEDPRNFGAIIRTAAAVGVSAIFIKNYNQVGMENSVFKTSAGTIFKIDIVEVSNISDTLKKLKNNGFWTYALDMSDEPENSLLKHDFTQKTALILGSEGNGISQKLVENSDFIISIPMENNVESLNVSVSGALAMYKWKEKFST